MDSKERRLERIKRKLNIRGDLRIKELKARYYELAYSIEMPAELNELKLKLAEGELTYQEFAKASNKLLMQDTLYLKAIELEREILKLDPTWCEYIRNMPVEQKVRILGDPNSAIRDRIVP